MVLFDVKSVAIVGASPREGKAGNIILRNFIKKFKGKIFPVNPNYDKIYDLPCFPSVKDVPGYVDLVVIAVPAKIVPKVLKDCAEKKVKLVIIISAGFSETGEEGRKLEDEILKIAKENNIRIIGPNGLGVYDPYLGIDTFFVDESRVPRPGKGNIAIISQSGAIALALMEWLSLHNIGVSKIISHGNRIDIDEVELLEYFKEDPNTKYIFIYLEGLKAKRGKEFLKMCKDVLNKGKKIIVLKAGKSKRGKLAVGSHTASMAGDYEVYYFAFKQVGIIEAKTFEDFLVYLKALSMLPEARGKRVCIYTNGGGEGVLTTDCVEMFGLEVPETSEGLKTKLKEILPHFASFHNPIDTTAQANEDQYLNGLKVVLESEDYDAVIAILLPQLPWYTEKFADKFKTIYKKQKPIVFVIYGGHFAKKICDNLEKIIPVFETPIQAVKTLFILSNLI